MNHKKIWLLLPLLLISSCTSTLKPDDDRVALNLYCDQFSWGDVETLVQPYLDDVLYTALVMQAQSSEYRTSSGAEQALSESLPEPIKHILQALIDQNC